MQPSLEGSVEPFSKFVDYVIFQSGTEQSPRSTVGYANAL